jgi:hypothetical protein
MSDKIAEIQNLLSADDPAAWVSQLWDKFNQQRRIKIEEWKELDLTWEGFSPDDNTQAKANAVEGYMQNKVRENNFRTTASKLVYDYIDKGNCFATSSFESRYKTTEGGDIIPDYIGPVPHRINPLDIVFNPLAESFDKSFKIVRSVKTVGELKKLSSTNPEQKFWESAIERRDLIRHRVTAGGYSIEDFDKAVQYQADGFGNMYEYYMGDYVEILEFFGDYHDSITGELQTERLITIVDRSVTVRNAEIPTWFGGAPIRHAGWRFRSDNLWAMGPLDNLVGLQYRLDHLENLKADAMDLTK